MSLLTWKGYVTLTWHPDGGYECRDWHSWQEAGAALERAAQYEFGSDVRVAINLDPDTDELCDYGPAYKVGGRYFQSVGVVIRYDDHTHTLTPDDWDNWDDVLVAASDRLSSLWVGNPRWVDAHDVYELPKRSVPLVGADIEEDADLC